MRINTPQPEENPRTRRHFSAEDKARILRRHLWEKVPISQLCDEEKLQPSVFYQWQAQLLQQAHLCFESQKHTSSHERKQQEQIAALQAKLQKKDSVIAEISAEYVQLKKELGEP